MSKISEHKLFNKNDLVQISEKGKTVEKVSAEIDIFKRDMSYINLSRPCTTGDGIVKINESELKHLAKKFEVGAAAGRMMKFTPASGAASRMFKLLLSFYYREALSKKEIIDRAAKEDEFAEFRKFLEGLGTLAFYDDLKESMTEKGLDAEELLKGWDYKPLLEYILTDVGLNYMDLPKGLVKFHSYGEGPRTSFEEHLFEGASYTKDISGTCRIHFTLSEEHMEIVKNHINTIKEKYENDGLHFNVGYSTQNSATDTLAVNMDNSPFRDDDNQLLFRPAGHGALLENLNNINGDIIFVKNIDNVAPDRLKNDTLIYKKALAGYLLELQNEIFYILRKLDDDNYDEDLMLEALQFMKDKLSMEIPESVKISDKKKCRDFVFSKLNRPLRVCGMVKNEGEPGGGPFWVKGNDGTISLQIVEKSQVNVDSDEQKSILEGATHFNPVDLVCAIRDYKGAPFKLSDFTDPDTCFISIKTSDERRLKVLELPGLWNGAMSKWSTIFIEVPLSTFNPVKTVLDLLRREHQ